MSQHQDNIAKTKNEIRQLLLSLEPERTAPVTATQAVSTSYGWLYAQAVLGNTEPVAMVCRQILCGMDPAMLTLALRQRVVLDSQGQYRAVYAPFAIACLLKATALVATGKNADLADLAFSLAHPIAHGLWGVDGHTTGSPTPVMDLWLAYTLKLASKHQGDFFAPVIDTLWQRATAQQTPAGHLHPLTAETCLDAFVFDELAALHGGFLLAMASSPDTRTTYLEKLHPLARYHLENTQPDNTTNQPWGLPAFAYWEDTATFAAQQLHDTRTWLATHPGPVSGLIAGLLADTLNSL